MADLPMIKIAADTESGWMLINESDFNPEEDDPYEPASSALVAGEEGGVAEAAKAAGEFLGEDWPAPGPLLDPGQRSRHSRPPKRTTGSAAN